MKKGIIFDLDGTLWDSAENVCKAWNEVFSFRYPQLNKKITVPELHSYMGKTLDVIGELMFPDLNEGLRNEIMQAACENENAFLSEHGGKLFESVIETLTALKEKYSLYIVSNCQAGYIETFLSFFEIGYLFEDFECPGRTGLGKGENIKLIIERCGLNRAIYVGDTQGDLEAADFAGIGFVHAAYGFGKTNRPTEIINSFAELIKTADRLLCE